MRIRSAMVCCPECRYLNDEELFPENENIVLFLLQMVSLCCIRVPVSGRVASDVYDNWVVRGNIKMATSGEP